MKHAENLLPSIHVILLDLALTLDKQLRLENHNFTNSKSRDTKQAP